ncbi:MAG: HD domain-containing phosphohydrolase [Thermodesulfobacteriota bacterium]
MQNDPQDTLKILVIDDEPIVLGVVSEALLHAGFDVLTASDGETGMEIFRREGPVIVLTDINMPGMSGFDLLKMMKKLSPAAQILVFSGMGTTGDVIEALRLGACDYLYKPLTVEFLIHTVMRCIERHELIQERINRNVMLEQQVAERTAALADTFYATVQSLGRLIEMRDPYTSGHQQRVSTLAVAIGMELGLTNRELGTLHVSGLLHDIGKAAVPAELLVKPTRLTPIEFQLIKCHPQAGYDVLKDIPFTDSLGKDVAVIVQQHHEHLDGSGYPGNITGDRIEPEAKILSVADVLEAMSSHRPYRPALIMESAKNELLEQSGRFYSPECVRAAIRLIEENGDDIDRLLRKTGLKVGEAFSGKST